MDKEQLCSTKYQLYVMTILSYCCIICRVFDVPESELLMHWDDTYKFIKEVK